MEESESIFNVLNAAITFKGAQLFSMKIGNWKNLKESKKKLIVNGRTFKSKTMGTIILSKKAFLRQVSDLIEENEIIIMSDTTCEIKMMPKTKETRLNFCFASKAFKKDGVGDLAFRKIPSFSFAICKESDCSEIALKNLQNV
jgi:oligoribonuclease NrnB/cAMP/cGMP phosphodiesterase (DHH superfamily)